MVVSVARGSGCALVPVFASITLDTNTKAYPPSARFTDNCSCVLASHVESMNTRPSYIIRTVVGNDDVRPAVVSGSPMGVSADGTGRTIHRNGVCTFDIGGRLGIGELLGATANSVVVQSSGRVCRSRVVDGGSFSRLVAVVK